MAKVDLGVFGVIRLDRGSLGQIIQVLKSVYLTHVGLCGKGRKEFIHIACKCLALVPERRESFF